MHSEHSFAIEAGHTAAAQHVVNTAVQVEMPLSELVAASGIALAHVAVVVGIDRIVALQSAADALPFAAAVVVHVTVAQSLV